MRWRMRTGRSAAAGMLAALAAALILMSGCGHGDSGRSPPAVDATGNWLVTWEWGGSPYTDPITLVMDAAGNVTGTFTHTFYGPMTVAGWVSGYDVHLVCSSGSDEIVIDMVAAADGQSASGSWYSGSDFGPASAVKVP